MLTVPVVDPRLRGASAGGSNHSYEQRQAPSYLGSNQPGQAATSASSAPSNNSITPFNPQSVLTTQQQSDPRLRGSAAPNTSMRTQDQQYMSGNQSQNNYNPAGLQGTNRSLSDPRLRNNMPGGPYRSQQMDNNREDYQRNASGNGPAYLRESESPSSVILSGTVTSSVSRPTVSAPVSNPPGNVNESVNELLSKLRELQNYQGGGMLNGSK
ncbi:hypothetical protein K7432_003699 [Basidiobolus ranarum]|uniref:Uncharacterized protein n=1 Tax=Basidiobolus ranarum TaxID=34480 RepID=A0ABR2W5S1_9FUNG